jgi:hypothetical protein
MLQLYTLKEMYLPYVDSRCAAPAAGNRLHLAHPPAYMWDEETTDSHDFKLIGDEGGDFENQIVTEFLFRDIY